MILIFKKINQSNINNINKGENQLAFCCTITLIFFKKMKKVHKNPKIFQNFEKTLENIFN